MIVESSVKKIILRTTDGGQIKKENSLTDYQETFYLTHFPF